MLGHILKEFDGLDEVFGWTSRCDLGLGAAVHQVLLSELHQEVGIQLDVEVQVGHSGLGLLNVQVQRCVEKTDRLDFVTLEAPFKLCFKERMV